MGVVVLSHDHMSIQSSDEDTSQFDSRFTKLTPFDSPVDAKLSESVNLHFKVCMCVCVCVGDWI